MRRIPGAPLEDIVEQMQRRRKARQRDWMVRRVCIITIAVGLLLSLGSFIMAWSSYLVHPS